MNKSIAVRFVLIATFLIPGCGSILNNPQFYEPSIPPHFLPYKEYMFHGAAFYGLSGAHAVGSLAFPDHLQAALGYTYFKREGGELIATELLGGAYFVFDEFILEIFAGKGMGKGSSETRTEGEIINGREQRVVRRVEGEYEKTIVQANFGRRTELLNTGLIVRVSQVDFKNLVRSTSFRGIEFSGSESAVLYEPGIFFSAGKTNVRFTGMATFPITRETLHFYLSPFTVSLGLSIVINP